MSNRQFVETDLENAILVANQADFDRMLAHLSQQQVIALDTESDSLFSYYSKVCLIQISACQERKGTDQGNTTTAAGESDGREIVDYLVDPLCFREIGALSSLLVDETIQIVMHAAYNDMLTLQKEYQFSFKRIFDTQLAARILGWKKTGLASILEEHFGIKSDKRMQRTDWGKRPLSERQLIYAQMDTHFLLELRNLQHQCLAAAGRLEEACEAFSFLETVDYHDRPSPKRTFWQMKSVREVPREKLAVVEALWHWRERTAQKLDRPPFKIMTDAVLTQIALDCPKNMRALESISGFGKYQSRRHGKALLATIAKGLKRPVPKPPTHKPRPDLMLDDETIALYENLRSWRTQTATHRGVDPDIIFSNDTLLSIAKQTPRSIGALEQIAEIGPWKAKTYGPDIFELLMQR